MTQVRFAPEVSDELAEVVVVWYEGKQQGLGEEFLDERGLFSRSSEAVLVPSLDFNA